MRLEKLVFIQIHKEHSGAVVFLCFLSLHGRFVYCAPVDLSSRLEESPALIWVFGAFLYRYWSTWVLGLCFRVWWILFLERKGAKSVVFLLKERWRGSLSVLSRLESRTVVPLLETWKTVEERKESSRFHSVLHGESDAIVLKTCCIRKQRKGKD